MNVAAMTVAALAFSAPALAAGTLAIDPAAGLMGMAHCQSEAGTADAYKTKIYLHEDFLQGDSYGILTGELLGVPAFNHFAGFITTKPGMSDEHFTLTITWNGAEMGTLDILDQGLSGTLTLEDVKLKCQGLSVPFEG